MMIDRNDQRRTENGGAIRQDDRQRLTLSEEELEVGKREHRAGEVGISKRVETDHVREQVPLRHEEVEIERRPIQGGMRGSARIEEDSIRVPVREEEAVVEKRAVPKEELVVRKRSVEEHQTVEADLRRERADIHRDGDLRRTDRDRR
jgi:uncharacterized protein (TIGR02271 family)